MWVFTWTSSNVAVFVNLHLSKLLAGEEVTIQFGVP